MRIVTDEDGRNYHEVLDEDTFNSLAGRIPKATAQELIRHARPKINDLIAQAKQSASKQQAEIIEQAVTTMHQSLQPEQDRLTALAKVNSSIREEEISYIADSQQLLAEYLTDAQLSLDAVRVAIVTA